MDRSFCRRPLKLPAKMQLQNALPTIFGLHNIIQCALHVEILKVSGSLWLAVIYCDVAHATIHFGDNYPPPDPMIASSDRTTTFLLSSSPCSRASQPARPGKARPGRIKIWPRVIPSFIGGCARERGVSQPASPTIHRVHVPLCPYVQHSN